jgi:hypothetical protein
MPYPALALGLAQRIDVDHRPPHRLAGQIVGQRRNPPQPALVIGIDPMVGDEVAHHLIRRRDLVRIVEQLQRACPMILKPWQLS